jgi:hypothetical protein
MSTSAHPVAVSPLRHNLAKRIGDLRVPSPAMVAAGICACLVVLRLPSTLLPRELNPDESQMLSQAMKFLLDPVPWRAVDGTSSGPLNSYLISILLLMGFKAGYILAHVLADALICAQMIVAHRTLLRLASEKIAAWAMLPMLLFFGLTANPDLLHYSSELLPSLFLALGFLGFTAWLENRRTVLLFASGLALGAAPWCKLQSLPIAGILGVLLLAAIARCAAGPMSVARRSAQVLAFCAGAALPACVILGVVANAGALPDLWSSYILGNLAYAGKKAWPQVLLDGGSVLVSAALAPLVALNVLGAAWLIEVSRKRKQIPFSPTQRWLIAGLLLYSVAALLAIARPVTSFDHYLVFLVYPLTCLTGVLAAQGLPLLQRREPVGKNTLRLASALVIAILAAYGLNSALYLVFSSLTIHDVLHPPQDANEKIAAAVRKLQVARGARSLAIWGWAPGVYVLSGIPPATRDAVGHNVISPGPLQGYYRSRFLADLREKMPDVFIDAVVPGAFLWVWKESDGYESDAALARFISENYVVVDQFPLRAGQKPVRVFARRP